MRFDWIPGQGLVSIGQADESIRANVAQATADFHRLTAAAEKGAAGVQTIAAVGIGFTVGVGIMLLGSWAARRR